MPGYEEALVAQGLHDVDLILSHHAERIVDVHFAAMAKEDIGVDGAHPFWLEALE